MGFEVDFAGKVAVVTGGNRGLGRGLSEGLAKAGASVAMIYRSAPDAEKSAAEVAEKYGVKVKAYKCDVSDQELVNKTFAQIEQDLGEIHGVVANSGISVLAPAVDLTGDDFDKVFGCNVKGAFFTAQAAARLWIPRKHKGSIVIISSMSSQICNHPLTQAFYNSSKGAVSNLGKMLASEWAEHGIRVNVHSPGFINTEQTSGMPQDLRDRQASEVPLGRFSEPSEHAGQIVFLLSDYSSYITGSEIFVDGGYLVR